MLDTALATRALSDQDIYRVSGSEVSDSFLVTRASPPAMVESPTGNAALGSISAASYSWLTSVLGRFAALISRPVGWDTYSGQPLRVDTASFAIQLLSAAMRVQSSVPSIVPTPDGGVQLEWHEKHVDLEVYIAAPYDVDIWFHDHKGEVADISQHLSNDFSILTEPLRLLASR